MEYVSGSVVKVAPFLNEMAFWLRHTPFSPKVFILPSERTSTLWYLTTGFPSGPWEVVFAQIKIFPSGKITSERFLSLEVIMKSRLLEYIWHSLPAASVKINSFSVPVPGVIISLTFTGSTESGFLES